MSLDAGSVFTTLGGRFNPAAFAAFDSANKSAAATMNSAEAKITASQARTAASARRTARAVNAAAGEQAAGQRRAAAASAQASGEQVAADQRRAASAKRAASARSAAANAEVAAARRAATAQAAAAGSTARAWAMVDRAQLKLYGSSRLVDQANERTRRSLHAVGRVARTGAAAGILAVGAAAVSGVRDAGDLEQQLNLVQVNARGTAEQMEAVRAKAVELGADLELPATSAADAAAVMLELVRGGFSVEQAMEAARGGLALGAAANIDNARATEIAVDALRAFSLEAGQAGRVADALAAGAIASSVEVPQLAQALQQAGQAANNAGLSVEETITALVQLANAGIKGSDAGTSLKTMLLSLSPNSEKAAEVMRRLGVSAFDAAGEIREFPDIIDDYSRALSRLTREERTAALKRIFGTDAYRAASVILARGVDAHNRMADAVRREGAATDVAAAQMDGYKGAQEALNNAWETGTTIIGTALLPKLTELGNEAAEAMGEFSDSGGAARLGDDLADGLDVAVDVLGRLAAAGADAVSVLGDIAGALQLDDADTLVSLAIGFAAFRVAGVVAPMVVSLAAGINAVVLAARTATSVGSFFAGIASFTNPITATAVAVGGLAGAIALLSGKGKSAEDFARDTADAFREAADAVQALDDALLGAADAQFAAISAERRYADARRATNRALKEHGRHSRQYREAVAAEREALYRVVAADKRAADERRRLSTESARTRIANARAVAQAEEERDKKAGEAQRELMQALRRGDGEAQTAAREKLVAAWRDYDDAVQRAARGTAQAAISSLQLNRLMEGQRLIAEQNYVAIGRLARVYDQLPRRTQTQLATTAEPALAEIGSLVGQLRQVPRRQVVQILARASSATAQIAALRATVEGVPARRVVQILGKTDSARVQVAALTAAVNGVPQRRIVAILEDGALPARVKVAALTAAIEGVPERKISQILENGALSAKGRVDALRTAIDSLPASRTSTITLNRVETYTRIYRTQNAGRLESGGRFRAAGKAAGGAETAIVGEGSRWQGAREAIVNRRTGTAMVVDRPMPMRLSDDDYVIPLDEHRGRAIGLMRMLAEDLGVQAFARGRAAKRRRRRRRRRRRERQQERRGGKRGGRKGRRRGWSVPARIADGGVPFADVRATFDDARDAHKRAADEVRRNRRDVGSARDALARARRDLEQARRNDASDSTKEGARERVAQAEKKLARAEKALRRSQETERKRKKRRAQWSRRFKAARRTDSRVKNLQSDVNVARDAMEDADQADDLGRFRAAKATRTKKLQALIAVLQRAFGLARPRSEHWRGLRELLSQLGGEAAVGGTDPRSGSGFGGELGQVQAEQIAASEPEESPEQRARREAAERLEDTGMTDVERARLEDLEAGVSLARLTDTLDDDRARQQQLVDFLGGILASVQADPARGGSPVIADIADRLHREREDLQALAGGGSHSDADVQAQLDQAQRERDDYRARYETSQRELAVFGGPGDIGAGGYGSALAAGGQPAGAPNITINTLHPGDPAVLQAIGGAATAGIGYQGGRVSPRQSVGVP